MWGAYAEYVKKSVENVTIAADEIERDLHRALPEVKILKNFFENFETFFHFFQSKFKNGFSIPPFKRTAVYLPWGAY